MRTKVWLAHSRIDFSFSGASRSASAAECQVSVRDSPRASARRTKRTMIHWRRKFPRQRLRLFLLRKPAHPFSLVLEAVCDKEVSGKTWERKQGVGRAFSTICSANDSICSSCVWASLFSKALGNSSRWKALMRFSASRELRPAGVEQLSVISPSEFTSATHSPSSCASFARRRELSASPVPPSTLRSFCSTARKATSERKTRAEDDG